MNWNKCANSYKNFRKMANEINGNENPKQLKEWTEEEMDATDGLTIQNLFNQGIGLTYNDFSNLF
jgi:hypothetical protein